MRDLILDLHIHSRYSMACSKNIDLKNLSKWARVKGIDILGTGDFTHPLWFKELKENLKEQEDGIYTYNGQKFIFQTEVSNIFYKDNKLRKVHNIILSPSLETTEQITEMFSKKGKLDSDGRPTFGSYSCEDLVYDLKNISKEIEIIPAHVWTPWFGLFGSKSGFDSIEECFGAQTKHINAIETGLSSDPPMNSKIRFLKDKAFVSFSDSHSFWPWRLGREATIIELEEISYGEVLRRIRDKHIKSTIEVSPSYGIYHYDGHRNCNFSSSPEETKKLNGLCPVCGGKLTLGVSYRVNSLADENIYREQKYYEMLPLHELIKLYTKTTQLTSKRNWDIYNKLIEIYKTEFNILLYVSEEELLKHLEKPLVDIIIKNRKGQIKVIPGYDGLYGTPVIDNDLSLVHIEQKQIKRKNKSLLDF